MVKFYFTDSKLRKQPLFAKNFTGNVKFQNPEGKPPSDVHVDHTCVVLNRVD